MNPPLRTIRLVERRPRECRLRRSDAEFLLAEHRGVVEVLPLRGGRYKLTARGYAGVIVAPSCRFVLRPKLPLDDLLFLLDPAAPAPRFEDRADAEPGSELVDYLAARLAERLAERVAAGLQRGYVEQAGSGAFLRGRLDVPAQMREAQSRRDRFHVQGDEHTADTPWNRLPKATAESLLRSPALAPATRRTLEQALQGFAEVRSVPLDPADFDGLTLDRLTEPYRPLLDLCRLLALGLTPAAGTGTAPAPAFLIDLERAFEQHVTRGIREACAGRADRTVLVQPTVRLHAPLPGRPELVVRPDVVIEESGRALRVIDAKWKRLDGPPEPDDLHQVLAYGVGLGANEVHLVYPGGRNRTRMYPLERSSVPMRVTLHTLRVRGGREKCRRALERLGRKLTR